MKTIITKTILTLIGLMFFSSAFAQEDYTKAPKENERVIGTVTETIDKISHSYYSTPTLNYNEVYSKLLEKAKKEYPNKIIDLRNVTYSSTDRASQQPTYATDLKGRRTDTKLSEGYEARTWSCNAKVVEFISPERKLNETLVKAVDKAMSKVRGGSRLAIDQISVSGKLDKESVNDGLLDILLDRGYRVVAKEYLEKLKEEQEQQSSGGFNENTTAKTDNFSGVGYFLNVRVNDKSIRVQVVNVSTGEYEGNATIDF